MIRLEGIAGLIDKVIRSKRLKALALKRLRFFLPHPAAIFRLKEPFNSDTQFMSHINVFSTRAPSLRVLCY